MCAVVYIAADEPLPLIPWDSSQPDFSVINLVEHDQKVVAHFSKPYIYYVCTKLGCGCDFQYGQYGEVEEHEEDENRKAVHQLSEYLAQETRRIGELEIFTCWEDDQAKAPTSQGVLHPSDFGGAAFDLEIGQLTKVLPDAA